MNINKRLEEIKSYVSENAEITTDVDVSYAESLQTQITNTEEPVEEFDLYSNSHNTHISLSLLDA